MLFFQNFPTIEYKFRETTGTSELDIRRVVPNMTIKLIMDIFTNPAVSYNEYRIQDNERPDIVATKLYGASRYTWIIMLANNMRDWYDWPLSDLQFYSYINRKYGSVQIAQQQVYQRLWMKPDGQQLVIDETFYNTLPPSEKRIIHAYDKEYEDNDKKRTIRVPEFEQLNYIITQVTKLLAQ